MQETSALTIIIVAANVLISYKGFKDRIFFEKNLFEVEKILVHGEYRRLFMSGFLHVDWMHLLFNMISFYSFGSGLEHLLGPVRVLVIYFASLTGGDLLALFIHRNHGGYRAVGASGAVSGIIFAAVALNPGMSLYLLFIPLPIPGWLFGICYVLYSIYGIRSRTGNIGHEAHLGGALIGLVTAIVMVPYILQVNLWVVLLIAIPCIVFLMLIALKPAVLIVDKPFGRPRGFQTKDDRYNARKAAEQKEIDRILEKIQKSGLHSLTSEEREKLERFSG